MYVLKIPRIRFAQPSVSKTQTIPLARKKIREQKNNRKKNKHQKTKHQMIKHQMIKHQTIKRQKISDNTNEASLIDKENFQKFVVNDIKDETVKSSSINQKKLL